VIKVLPVTLVALVVAACGVFALGRYLVSGGCLPLEDCPSAGRIQESVEASIKPGATLAEIQAYLDGQDIEHSPEVGNASNWSELEKYGLPPDTPIYAAIVRGSRFSSVSIIFVLDKDLRFQRLILIDRPPQLGP
jgi:hypothetical protein